MRYIVNVLPESENMVATLLRRQESGTYTEIARGLTTDMIRIAHVMNKEES